MKRSLWAVFCSLFVMLGAACSLALADPVQEQTASRDYRLGTGDKIRIQVFDEPDLSFEVRVTDAGAVTYPFLGEVKLSGRTPVEVETTIYKGLKGGFLVEPKVHVSILEYRQFYVNGEVKQPGGFSFIPGLTVRKAVSLAGGLTDRASEKKIFVIRDDDPTHKRQQVSMEEVLRPGDIVTVEQSFF